MGHAGTIIFAGKGTAAEKFVVLEEAGVKPSGRLPRLREVTEW
ncbi:hypothetical protein [Aeromonas cavernicola]